MREQGEASYLTDIYEKNVNALNKYQPQIGSSYVSKSSENEVYTIVTGDDGLLNIKCSHNDEELYIHGENSCIQTAEIRTEQIVLKNGGLIVSFGCGLGYEMREIIKKMVAGSSLIILEPCAEIFETALRHSDMTDIISSPNVHFLPFDWDNEKIRGFMSRFVNRQNYKSAAAFVVSPYVKLFFEKMRTMFFTLDSIRSSFEKNEATILAFTAIWQRNALLNAKHNLNSYLVSDFFDMLKLPAVIVSAGPSLDKNICELKQMEDKVLIISVDTALKPLLKNGITPHFVATADAQELVAEKFKNVEYSHIPLLYVPTSSHAVVDAHMGTKVLSPIQDNFYSRLLKSVGKDASFLELGGSVSTLAFSFAQRAGCNPIILAGQDLAFTDMKTHTEGAAFSMSTNLEQLLSQREIFTALAVGGGEVYTDSTFQTYGSWLQAFAASDKAACGREYIDATEGGIKLAGFTDMTLNEALSRYSVDGGVVKLVSDCFEKAALLSASEKKHFMEGYKSAAVFIESIKNPAKSASKQLAQLSKLLTQKKPSSAIVRAAYSKIRPFESRIKTNEDKLGIIGISLEPVAEKLNNEFANAEFTLEQEKNQFAASCYAAYYNELFGIIEEFEKLIKDPFA